MRIGIVTVGDEILLGQVVDTNSAWIGQQLAAIGVEALGIYSIKDDAEEIKKTLKYLAPLVDYILMTGGLGPTKDDITKKSLSELTGAEMVWDQATYDRIQALFAKYGRKMQESHIHQCYMPSDARLIENPMGTAPGMVIPFQSTTIVSMPGVPYEMKAIMEGAVLQEIAQRVGDENRIVSRTIMTAGQGESYLETMISDITDEMPQNMSVAYLPSLGSVRLRVNAKGKIEDIGPLVEMYTHRIAKRINEYIYGYDGTTMTQALMNLCVEKELTIGTAESCTGGYIGHMITSDPGSSRYFLGSIVSYANDVKRNLLGVEKEVLDTYGAVSQQTVEQMAKGALNTLGVDIAISVSGIAGPDGGSTDKPVGTIWMCIANNDTQYAFKIQATKDRLKNIEYAGNLAINNLRKFIQKHY